MLTIALATGDSCWWSLEFGRIADESLLSDSVWGGRERAFSNTTFLVCVHNVSAAQPYAIIRAPVSSTAQDIIVQVLHKARRVEAASEFVLVEEVGGGGGGGGEAEEAPPPSSKLSVGSAPWDSPGGPKSWRYKASAFLSSANRERSPSSASGRSWMSSVSSSGRSEGHRSETMDPPTSRVLLDSENVCDIQSHWKVSARFLLSTRQEFLLQQQEAKPKKKSLVGMRSLNFGRSKHPK